MRVMWHLSRWESSQGEFRSPPIFLNLFYKLLDEERAPSSPLWGFPRRSHCILSLSGRHGFRGRTSSRPEWGPSFPGQSLPLSSPAPGRHPGCPAAVAVQGRAAPGGQCPRQQRSTLCGRGWSSAGTSHGAQRWPGPPGAGHPPQSAGKNQGFSVLQTGVRGESAHLAQEPEVLLETSTWFWDRSQPRDPPTL